jgi:hypothetical protein
VRGLDVADRRGAGGVGVAVRDGRDDRAVAGLRDAAGAGRAGRDREDLAQRVPLGDRLQGRGQGLDLERRGKA